MNLCWNWTSLKYSQCSATRQTCRTHPSISYRRPEPLPAVGPAGLRSGQSTGCYWTSLSFNSDQLQALFHGHGGGKKRLTWIKFPADSYRCVRSYTLTEVASMHSNQASHDVLFNSPREGKHKHTKRNLCREYLIFHASCVQNDICYMFLESVLW